MAFKFAAQFVDGFDDAQLNFEQLQTLIQQTGSSFPFLPQPSAKAWCSTAPGTARTTGAAIPFDTIVWDDFGGAVKATGVAGTAGFQAPAAGKYFVSGNVPVVATAASQDSVLQISVAGTAQIDGGIAYSTAAAQNLYAQASGIVKCNAGDLVQLLYQGTTGLLGAATATSQAANFLTVTRLS